MPEIIRSYKSSLSTGTTAHEPSAPLLSLSSDTTYRCAVITPIGPGHETLYEESLASVKRSFADRRGNFSEIIPIRIDDPEGKLGRSKARNLGIQKAVEYGVEWIFFLDADDLMAPAAFEYVSPYLESYDGIWGSIWSIEKRETTAKERPKQLPFLYSIEDVLSCDPFVTLQMGHFVRTRIALSTLFDESLDTGEDFDYYLRVWEKYKCIKTSLPFFYNRRGLHAHGPRSATGLAWRRKVEDMINKKRPQLFPR
jgi:glycosyltransferase involved in cell wall biosynthesis